MMLQKLPIFLEENDAKLLIKYDGERGTKNYTVRLLFNDMQKTSLGKDTDSPYDLLNALFEESKKSIKEEMLTFFSKILIDSIENLKRKYGISCVITILLEEKDGSIIYTLHFQTTKYTKCLSGMDYVELYEKLISDEKPNP